MYYVIDVGFGCIEIVRCGSVTKLSKYCGMHRKDFIVVNSCGYRFKRDALKCACEYIIALLKETEKEDISCYYFGIEDKTFRM